MSVVPFTIQVKMCGFCDFKDITSEIESFVSRSGIVAGIVNVFVPGSTAAVTTVEYESGVIQDLKRAIEQIAPQNIHYDHDEKWNDGNGFAHVRASLIGPSLSIPLMNGALQLGTWQQVVLIDFDNRPRMRSVIIQILGE